MDTNGSTGTMEQAATEFAALLDRAPDVVVAEEPAAEAQEVEAAAEDPEDLTEEEGVEAVEAEASEEISDEDTEASPEEADAPSIETTLELAEALEVPIEELLTTFKHKIKIDGAEKDTSLDSIIRGYQKGQHWEGRASAIVEQEKALQKQTAERMKALDASHAQAAFMVNALEKGVQQDLSSPKMQELRTTDPAEWGAKRAELEDRRKALGGLKQVAAQQFGALQQQTQQATQEHVKKTLEAEREKLQVAMPEWSDSHQKRLVEFLGSDMKFTQEEIGQVYDSRFVQMAWDAMQYRTQKDKATETVKKVKKAPKLVRSNAKKSTSSVKRSKVAELRGRLRKSGDVKDAAALIESAGFLDT